MNRRELVWLPVLPATAALASVLPATAEPRVAVREFSTHPLLLVGRYPGAFSDVAAEDVRRLVRNTRCPIPVKTEFSNGRPVGCVMNLYPAANGDMWGTIRWVPGSTVYAQAYICIGMVCDDDGPKEAIEFSLSATTIHRVDGGREEPEWVPAYPR